MIQVVIFGASGYSGAEMVRLVNNNTAFELVAAFNSASSEPCLFGEIFPSVAGAEQLPVQPATSSLIEQLHNIDIAFLAVPHEASVQLTPLLLAKGIRVVDLSGAFRIKDKARFESAYGFEHPCFELVKDAHYSLMDWEKPPTDAYLCSVPGCYPTAASLALLPLINNGLVHSDSVPFIHAVSGVTGAGRKASIALSFAEVSYTAYGLKGHRHTPEIEQNLNRQVQFIPHLAPFKRGLMATCMLELSSPENAEERVSQVFENAYDANPLVRLRANPPKLDDVTETGFCDIHWQVRGRHLVVVSAIDNLLKGAAGQAMQTVNHLYGYPEYQGIHANV